MKLSQFFLLKLAEECSEVSHRAMKQIQFGPDEIQRGQDKPNNERLREEILDLMSLVKALININQIEQISADDVLLAYEAKIAKIGKYLKLSEELGEIYIND